MEVKDGEAGGNYGAGMFLADALAHPAVIQRRIPFALASKTERGRRGP